MKYLLTADRLGRNFCEKGRDLCAAGRFPFHLKEKTWICTICFVQRTEFQLQTQIRRKAWKRETLQLS